MMVNELADVTMVVEMFVEKDVVMVCEMVEKSGKDSVLE